MLVELTVPDDGDKVMELENEESSVEISKFVGDDKTKSLVKPDAETEVVPDDEGPSLEL